MGEPREVRGGHLEAGVGHAERTEEAVVEQALERLAGHALQHPAGQVEGDRIAPGGAGLRVERQRREGSGEAVEIGLGAVGRQRAEIADRQQAEASIFALQRAVAGDVVAEARRVGEEMADADRRFGRAAFEAVGRVGQDPHRPVFGEEIAQRRVEREGPARGGLDGRDPGDGLGHGIDAPQAVGGDRAAFAVAGGSAGHHIVGAEAPRPHDGDDGAGHAIGSDRPVEPLLEGGVARGGPSEQRRRRGHAEGGSGEQAREQAAPVKRQSVHRSSTPSMSSNSGPIDVRRDRSDSTMARNRRPFQWRASSANSGTALATISTSRSAAWSRPHR